MGKTTFFLLKIPPIFGAFPLSSTQAFGGSARNSRGGRTWGAGQPSLQEAYQVARLREPRLCFIFTFFHWGGRKDQRICQLFPLCFFFLFWKKYPLDTPQFRDVNFFQSSQANPRCISMKTHTINHDEVCHLSWQNHQSNPQSGLRGPRHKMNFGKKKTRGGLEVGHLPMVFFCLWVYFGLDLQGSLLTYTWIIVWWSSLAHRWPRFHTGSTSFWRVFPYHGLR